MSTDSFTEVNPSGPDGRFSENTINTLEIGALLEGSRKFDISPQQSVTVSLRGGITQEVLNDDGTLRVDYGAALPGGSVSADPVDVGRTSGTVGLSAQYSISADTTAVLDYDYSFRQNETVNRVGVLFRHRF